jgi:ABC-type uncharacterized transport system substrate-binding protein
VAAGSARAAGSAGAACRVPPCAPPPTREIDAFTSGLVAHGFTPGRNVVVVPAWGDGNPGRFPELASKLAGEGVDLVVAEGSLAMRAAHQALPNIPIVFTCNADPFIGGLVASLSHPGGRATGLSMQAVDLTGKMIDILKEMVPSLSRVAMIGPRAIWSIFGPVHDQAANKLGIESINVELQDANKPGDAMQDAIAQKASGFILRGTPFYSSVQRKGIVEAAALHKLPAMYESLEYVEQGGLIAYATDGVETYRRVAEYVARILNGANPGDIPIQQPTKFELAINAKTAKVLGLTVPSQLLSTADEVIE